MPAIPKSNVRTQRPYHINGTWYYPLPSAQGYVEEGIASWYGKDFHGKPTSCGEIYDMWGQSAAHKTLPLGTHVKVTRLDTGKSVIVRVNDRGPFVAGRIIDLSCGTAKALGSEQQGIIRVRVEAVQVARQEQMGQQTVWKVDPTPSFRYGRFFIQVGAFKEQKNAVRLKDKFAGRYGEAAVAPPRNGGPLLFRVQVGAFQDIQIAQKELQRLRGQGYPDAFVVASEGR